MFEYELWQGGEAVAWVSANTQEAALREITHYAMVYSQDGPVQIVPPNQGAAQKGEGQ